jgi:lysophospholipase L1-like esterase
MRTLVIAGAVLMLLECGGSPPLPSEKKQSGGQPPHSEKMRIVTLGDSLAYGAGDEGGGGIAVRLDKILRQRGIDTTVTNLGVNGAQTADLIARLRQDRVRTAITNADAVVLSIGANDLFRNPSAREETLRAPLLVAERILTRLEEIVRTLHTINPNVKIMVLGGYNPVPTHPSAPMINQYLGLWDATLASRFSSNPRVAVIRMADVVNANRLSRHDNFHPGGEAYQEASERIAAMLFEEDRRQKAEG